MSKDYYGGGGFGGPERARTRKAIDPSSALLLELESRPLVSRKRKCGGLLPTAPHREYCRRIVPPSSMLGDPTAGVTNVLCHTCMNKARADKTLSCRSRDDLNSFVLLSRRCATPCTRARGRPTGGAC